MNGEDRVTVLKVLRTFFRISAVAFLLVTFSISVDEKGTTWIMWRDSMLTAVTLVCLALLMAAGWLYSALRLKRLEKGEEKPASLSLHDVPLQPYNIWKPMLLRTRMGLAAAGPAPGRAASILRGPPAPARSRRQESGPGPEAAQNRPAAPLRAGLTAQIGPYLDDRRIDNSSICRFKAPDCRPLVGRLARVRMVSVMLGVDNLWKIWDTYAQKLYPSARIRRMVRTSYGLCPTDGC